MNRIALLILIILLCVASSADAQLTSPDSVIHRMFAAVKANDEKAFRALHPSPEQMLKAVKNELHGHYELVKRFQSQVTHPSKANYDSLYFLEAEALLKPENFAAMYSAAANGLRYVIERGKEKGIDWAKATFIGFDTTAAPGEGQIEIREAIKRRNGTLDFSVEDSAYQLRFFNVAYLPSESGWFGGSFVYDDDDIEVREVIIQSVEEHEPPPPSRKPVKTKTKNKKPAAERKI